MEREEVVAKRAERCAVRRPRKSRPAIFAGERRKG